jgi:hypothetical protein
MNIQKELCEENTMQWVWSNEAIKDVILNVNASFIPWEGNEKSLIHVVAIETIFLI